MGAKHYLQKWEQNNHNCRNGSKTIIIAEMGAKHSSLSEEDFLFLEEETGMSKATLEVGIMWILCKLVKL